MKLLLILSATIVLVFLSDELRAQNLTKSTISFTSTTVSASHLLEKLKHVEGVYLSYNESSIDLEKAILLQSTSLTALEALDLMSQFLNLEYTFHEKQIILKSKSAKNNLKATFTLTGFIRDKTTGEILPGATVRIKNNTFGTVANYYGYYSITLSSKQYDLIFSHVGYHTEEISVVLDDHKNLSVGLTEETSQLKELVVLETKRDDNVSVNQMSYNKLDIKAIDKIPVLFGEADPMKVVKLLPGVSMTSETSSNFSVRGGSYDQNLILLDEAVVYNPSHLAGLFSTFNNDALHNIEFYKGNLPARFGGRLSSLLDIRMKDGNSKNLRFQGGISPIASRLTVEIPVIKDKSSLMISGRRTYLDLLTKLSKDEIARNAKLHFFDFNAKANISLNKKNKIFISSYYGRDVLGVDFNSFAPSFEWGNQTSTLRWNRLHNEKLLSNLSFIASKYDYQFKFIFNDYNLDWHAEMNDYSIKLDYDYFFSPSTTFTFGGSSCLHIFNPGKMKLKANSISGNIEALSSNALEHAVYAGVESELAGGRVLIAPGARISVFQNVGPYTLFEFDNKYEIADTTFYQSGKIFNTYLNPEPRLAVTYRITSRTSAKAGYARSIQYLHLASNSIAGTPLDVWVPSTPNVKPQRSDQVSVGIFQNLFNNTIETTTEVYYKEMNGQIDFKDHASLMLNKKLEGEFRSGKAEAWGLELMVKKPIGKLNGWISYTYSRTTRTIDGVNEGKKYLSPYDRPHNLSVVANYRLSKRLDFSANWVSFTGSPITAPQGKYEYQGSIVPVYSDRNGDRLPNYQRLDVGLTLKARIKEGKKFYSDWNFSVYNALNKKNAAFINFVQNEENPNKTEAIKYSILPIIPTVTWNFNF